MLSLKKSVEGSALALVLGSMLAIPSAAQETKETGATEAPQVTIETNRGIILIELDPENAPLSTANFLEYVREGFYDGTIFHRVIDGFMIQGGGFTEEMKKKDVREPIRNESDNGLKNERGTIAMARQTAPHSATAQFYINTVDNASLNMRGGGGWGYAVFGKVLEGMDVVDAIAKSETGFARNGMRDVPVEPIVMIKVTTDS